MDVLDSLDRSFSPDYATARQRFVDTAGAEGGALAAHVNPNPGPRGEELATDTAWFGPEDAERVVVLVSATHGVEGFCGSGCQIDWLLDGGPARLPDGVAALLVHAINPHGFAWLRRVTEEGCDLNRNFLDFTKPVPENPGHDELVDAFVPASLDEASLAAASEKIAAYRAAHGERAFQTARKAGQYRHAHSVFFGGFGPSWARRTLEAITQAHGLGTRRIVSVVDYHTGLGPFGYGEPICGHLPGGIGMKRVTETYGDSVGVPELGTSSSIPLHGTARDLWDRVCGDRYTYVALEYGTYSTDRGLVTLRQDHWLHNRGPFDWDAAETRRIKDALKHHYHPDSADWKEMVLWRSRQIIRQTLDAIRAW